MQKRSFVSFFVLLAMVVPGVALAQYGGGGSSSAPAPTVSPSEGSKEAEVKVVINNGAATTATTDVTLKLPKTSGDQMAISNYSDFKDSSWEKYAETASWVLQPGAGSKTVYVKFRSSGTGKTTEVVSGKIILVSLESPQEEAKAEPETSKDSVEDEATDGCALTPGSAYKTSSSYGVFYVTDDCTKVPFKNPTVFYTYFNSWNEVKVTTKLGSLKNDPLDFMPFGPKFDPKYGALVKIVKDPKVYLLLGNKKYWITDETVFTSLKYQWDWIEDIDKALLDKYETAGEITDTSKHPDNTLIKYKNSPKVYKLLEGKKSWITTEEAFKELGYRFDRVVTVLDSEVYEDGPDIE